MAPGERYEILVNLSNETIGNSIDLESHSGPDSGLGPGFGGFEEATSGEFGSLLNHRTFTVLHINIGASTANGITALPAKLAANGGLAALTADNATQSRTLGITGGGDEGPFTFNGLPFDMERIDQDVALGATEVWTVGAGAVFSHSFHIHGVQFRIASRNGDEGEVKPWERGWKDTFYLPIGESVTFVAKWIDTADGAYPFMYHCHMINHEDEGLMGQFTVQ
jgi:bilirubin oxidase